MRMLINGSGVMHTGGGFIITALASEESHHQDLHSFVRFVKNKMLCDAFWNNFFATVHACPELPHDCTVFNAAQIIESLSRVPPGTLHT